MRGNRKSVLFVLLWMSGCGLSAWGAVPESPMDVPVEDVLNSPELKAIGFPFENLHPPNGMIFYFDIGRCIVYLFESGQMAEDKRMETLDGILNRYRNQNAHPLATVNERALSLRDKSLSREMLIAALVLGAHTGAIRNIAPYLEYKDLFFGDDQIAWQCPADGRVHFDPVGYSSETRLKLWPAQNAIVSNATTTVPLLREAVMDDSLSLILRDWAVEYLLYLDQDILRWQRLRNAHPQLLNLCLSAGMPVFRWKNMPPDDEKAVLEGRVQRHRELLFRTIIRGYLDQRLEEARQNP